MPTTKRRVKRQESTGWAAADIAALGRSRESFRESQAHEIRRVASAISTAGLFRGIDSTRYRTGVTRAADEVKVAESVVKTFQRFEWDATFRREREALRRGAERGRDSHHRAARALRRIHPARAELEERDARDYKSILDSLGSTDQEVARLCAPAAHFESLTLDLVAIFWHTTDLTRHHVLTKIAPGILSVSLGCYPDSAPGRGAEGPLDRFKRLRRQTDGLASDDLLYHRRFLLFAGDDRFPQNLFAPHRTIRTAPPTH